MGCCYFLSEMRKSQDASFWGLCLEVCGILVLNQRLNLVLGKWKRGVLTTGVCAMSLQSCLSMGFSRQEYWSGFPGPPPGDLPDSGFEPVLLTSPALAGEFFTTRATCEILWKLSWAIKALFLKYKYGMEQTLLSKIGKKIMWVVTWSDILLLTWYITTI